MRRTAIVLAVAALGVGPATAWGFSPASPHFEERVLAVGLDRPTALAWMPNGNLLVAEKSGVVKLFDRRNAPLGRTVLDISRRVSAHGDRGLLGLEVDHDFRRNRFLYVSYTHDANPADPVGPKTARVGRFVLSRAGRVRGGAAGEKILIGRVARAPCRAPRNRRDCMPTDGDSHSIGAVRAAPDGTLWVAMGDGAFWTHSSDVALRSFNPRSYSGKLLHIDRNGLGVPGHPFCPGARDLRRVCTKVYARGFRNPFRFTLAPDGTPLVGDVGWNSREEINLVEAGQNYGWPCYEGDIRTPGYDVFGVCRRLYALEGTARAAREPALAYPRGDVGSSVVAGPRYPATASVGPFRGAFFFGDYVTGHLFRVTGPIAGHRGLELFASGWKGVDLQQGPDGALTYVDIRRGRVAGIYHVPGNRTPVARARAEPASGRPPLRVRLRAVAHDPDGDDLTYSWRLGDGTRASGPSVNHNYRRAGKYVARLTVTDPHGASTRSAARIFVGSRPPRSRIVWPRDGSRFVAGQPVVLRGVGRDPEEGRLPGRTLHWRVILHHGDHEHYISEGQGGRFAFTPVIHHDADSRYEISVFAVNRAGLTQRRAPHRIVLRPKTTRISVESQPAGAPIVYGGRQLRAPVERRTAVGYMPQLVAAEAFERDGVTYRFARWADGSAERGRRLVIRPRPMRLVAIYEPAR